MLAKLMKDFMLICYSKTNIEDSVKALKSNATNIQESFATLTTKLMSLLWNTQIKKRKLLRRILTVHLLMYML